MFEGKNKKKLLIGSISITSAFLLFAASMVPTMYVIPSDEKPKIVNTSVEWDIIVPDDYKSIFDALNNAEPYDRIFIRSGQYSSFSMIRAGINIKKEGLELCGEDKNDTIINNHGLRALSILADYVKISGFTIKNSLVNSSVISIYSNYCNISDNIFDNRDYYDGFEYVLTMYNANYNNFYNNEFSGGDKAVDLQNSNYNFFYNNIIENSDYSINVDGSSFLKFIRFFSKEIQEQIYDSLSDGNVFIKNTIRKCLRNVDFDGCSNTIFENNSIKIDYNSALRINNCINMSICNNSFWRGGITIAGKEEFNFYHTISGNTIANKPIYYLKDESDIKIENDVGQIILFNCEEIEISNVIIVGSSTAVFIAYSEDVFVYNSEFTSNNKGVVLYYSEFCSVTENNFVDNLIHASFLSKGFRRARSNYWRDNYWGKTIGEKNVRFQIFKKDIYGGYKLSHPLGIIKGFGLVFPMKCYDRSPEKDPYII